MVSDDTAYTYTVAFISLVSMLRNILSFVSGITDVAGSSISNISCSSGCGQHYQLLYLSVGTIGQKTQFTQYSYMPSFAQSFSTLFSTSIDDEFALVEQQNLRYSTNRCEFHLYIIYCISTNR